MKQAFTLIELLVVVAIIGVLATVGVLVFNGFVKYSQDAAIKSQNQNIYKFIQSNVTMQCIGKRDENKIKLTWNSGAPWFQDKSSEKLCNETWGSPPEWTEVANISSLFNTYYKSNPEVNIKNVVDQQSAYGQCPSIGDLNNLSPGKYCITYESTGSKLDNACYKDTGRYETWIRISSILSDKTIYTNCVYNTW